MTPLLPGDLVVGGLMAGGFGAGGFEAGGFGAGGGLALVQPPSPAPDPGGQGEDFGKAAPVGLVVLLLFFLAVALLVRSMNKHLRRVPKSFDEES